MLLDGWMDGKPDTYSTPLCLCMCNKNSDGYQQEDCKNPYQNENVAAVLPQYRFVARNTRL